MTNTPESDQPGADRSAHQHTQPTTPLPESFGEAGVEAGHERPRAEHDTRHAQDAHAHPTQAQAQPLTSGSAQAHTSSPGSAQASTPTPGPPQAQTPPQAVSTAHAPSAVQPAGPQHVDPPYGPEQQSASSAEPRSRGGALLAGLAIGALLGGVVGGGVAAIVASNATTQVSTQSSNASPITLGNADNATQISGVAAVATPSVVTLQVTSSGATGSGSGVIVREDGYIITNAHVVTLDGAASDPQVRVKLSDGRILDGQVVGTAPYADLAVVKVEADDLPAIEIADSDSLNVGDLTVAIGAPLNLANTVTSGVVSALNRGISVGSALVPQDQSVPQEDGGIPWDFRFGLPNENETPQQQTAAGTVTLPVIQTDASINPGNSGGALLNGNGELIGVNVAIASPTSSEGVAASAGLGFAIPANLASRIADEIIAGEQPSHGLLGATVADSSQDQDEDANHAGGLLVELTRGGAADQAGLRSGDVITAIDGVPAVDGTSVSALIRMHPGGSTVAIDYTRGGNPGSTEVELGTLEW